MRNHFVLHAGPPDADGNIPQLVVDTTDTAYSGMIMSWIANKDGDVDPYLVVYPSDKNGWETPFWAHMERLGTPNSARVLLAIWYAAHGGATSSTSRTAVRESSICDLMWEATKRLLPDVRRGTRPEDEAHVLELVLQAIDACSTPEGSDDG